MAPGPQFAHLWSIVLRIVKMSKAGWSVGMDPSAGDIFEELRWGHHPAAVDKP